MGNNKDNPPFPGLSDKTKLVFSRIDKIPQICGNCNLFKIPGPNPFGEADEGVCTKRNKPVKYGDFGIDFHKVVSTDNESVKYKDKKCSEYKINLVIPLVVVPPMELFKPQIFEEFMEDPLVFLKRAFPQINDDQSLLQFARAIIMNTDRILNLSRYF